MEDIVMFDPIITLIATETIDSIDYIGTGKKLKRTGGPAFYCGNAIEANGVKVSKVTSQHTTNVYITIKSQKEEIYIPKIYPIILESEYKLPSKCVLLSPILNEFKLDELKKYDCEIFLDLQGYIRGDGVDTCKSWSYDIESLKHVVAVKVNRRELCYLDSKILDSLKKRILIITKDVDGIELWYKGEKSEFSIKQLEVTDTIGAGDTFFGAFVVSFLKTKSVKDSILSAIEYTETFLNERRVKNA